MEVILVIVRNIYQSVCNHNSEHVFFFAARKKQHMQRAVISRKVPEALGVAQLPTLLEKSLLK